MLINCMNEGVKEADWALFQLLDCFACCSGNSCLSLAEHLSKPRAATASVHAKHAWTHTTHTQTHTSERSCMLLYFLELCGCPLFQRSHLYE